MTSEPAVKHNRDRLWRTSNGDHVRLRDMTDRHLLYLLQLLRKRQEGYARERETILSRMPVETRLSPWDKAVLELERSDNKMEDVQGWIRDVEAEAVHRGLTPGGVIKGTSSLTQTEVDYILARVHGAGWMTMDNDMIYIGDEYPLEIRRYEIASEMQRRPITDVEERKLRSEGLI